LLWPVTALVTACSYRDLSSNLKTYSTLNQLPPELKDEMQEHLRLKFNHQEASDDQVGLGRMSVCLQGLWYNGVE
jgi:hypothetical protein